MTRTQRGLVGVLIILILTGCGRKAETTIIIAGSTSVQPYAEILAEAYNHQKPEVEIDIQGGGSSAGITAVSNGIADIGMSSRDLKPEEKFYNVEIAKDGLAIIVNPQNPVSNLSEEQIRAIYAREITNWKEVGGNDGQIHIITREDGSGTRSAFEEKVMTDGYEISPKAIVQDSNGTVLQLVSSDKNAIGFVSLGLVDNKVKALHLGGVAATRENVIDGSYDLYRPFLFIFAEKPQGEIANFVDFVLSEEGQRILTAEGLIPE